VRARKTKGDTIGREEGSKINVKEFTAIVTLHTLNNFVELGFDISEETLKSERRVGFVSKRKSPGIMRIIT
jgi:hypothetical protein